MPTIKSIRGRKAETYVCAYLRRRGYKLCDRNYRYAGGELDIIAKAQNGTWLFVEVKSVWEKDVGAPDTRVGKNKQRKIWRTALHYLHGNNALEQNSRFDFAAMDFRFGKQTIRYYQDAFIAPQIIPDLRINDAH